MRKWLCWLTLSILFLHPSALTAGLAGPEDVINTLNTALLAAMKKGNEINFQERYRFLEPIITDSFALHFMARIAAGRAWRQMDEEQQQAYVQKYSEYSIAIYTDRFDLYDGQKFSSAQVAESAGDSAKVTNILTKADGEKVFFTYQLRKNGGPWQIVDIQISGVSQLALTRTQFMDKFKKEGFAGLMAMLAEKIADLEKKEPHG